MREGLMTVVAIATVEVRRVRIQVKNCILGCLEGIEMIVKVDR